ncbi:MAG TPA: 3-isopropylmalate dehydrogenase [Holophagaceae bacterium]|jgi:3-isopropylmalate dehydrogenase|nr:3-isopropylmalate dehydrogenase [Holophagaceae bacterium]
MKLNILSLPGDGIGPEVITEAEKVLACVAGHFGHELRIERGLIGAAALKNGRGAFPVSTRAAVKHADAVLLGAVGLPEYDQHPPAERPEKGLLELRAAMGVFANLRPVKAYPSLLKASPLKEERIAGTDLLILRELTGGLYFGEPRGIAQGRATNTMSYTEAEIERVARLAFELARGRRRKVTSVDKANVLENSQLWRQVVNRVGQDYPDIRLEHLLVDNAAMQLVLEPTAFDVLLTENLFGDILSDEAAVLAGSIGLLASASLGARRADGAQPGLYEPIHGSAPGIAGQSLANPLGAIGSVALMLEWSFGLRDESALMENAIAWLLEKGPLTPDLGGRATTGQVGDALCARLEAFAGAPE